jgi:hypothetical protein
MEVDSLYKSKYEQEDGQAAPHLSPSLDEPLQEKSPKHPLLHLSIYPFPSTFVFHPTKEVAKQPAVKDGVHTILSL